MLLKMQVGPLLMIDEVFDSLLEFLKDSIVCALHCVSVDCEFSQQFLCCTILRKKRKSDFFCRVDSLLRLVFELVEHDGKHRHQHEVDD